MAVYLGFSQRFEKNTFARHEDGGEIVLVMDAQLPQPALNFVRASSRRVSYIADLEVPLPLPGGMLLSNIRSIDMLYPLHGKMQIDSPGMRGVFIDDAQKQLTGVAANAPFLERAKMKIGDVFSLQGRNYQIRGILVSLPDASGQALNDEPLLVMRNYSALDSGLWMASKQREVRYHVTGLKDSPQEWEQSFRHKFPRLSVRIEK